MRLRFRCESIKQERGLSPKYDENGGAVKNEKGHQVYENGVVYSVRLVPVELKKRVIGKSVAGRTEENLQVWGEVYFSGGLTLDRITPQAVTQFKVGEEVFIDISEATGGEL